MDNILSKGLLMTVATALVGTGVVLIATHFLYGLLALVVGAGVYILREFLKKKGYPVSKSNEEK